MARVLVTRPLPAGGLDPLVERGHDIDQRDGEWADGLAAADALVCHIVDRIDDDVLAAAPRLRVVATASVGYDHVDVAACARRDVVVVNTPGVLDETTADTAFGLVIAARRMFSHAESELRSGRWTGWAYEQYLGHDVYGTVLGLVGYGRIARAVARRATGFGMTVRHHTRHDTGEPGWTADLHELLGVSDAVSIHVPLSDQTRHLVGAAELAVMKSSAVLVNTSRGPVVDEAALARALHERRIFGAGLDVYEREPQVHPDLLTAPNVTLLPHIGSGSVRTRTEMARLAARGAAEVLDGVRPANAVAPPE